MGAVVDKVKEAVGAVEEIIDENILDFCSLDKVVGVPKPAYCSKLLKGLFRGATVAVAYCLEVT